MDDIVVGFEEVVKRYNKDVGISIKVENIDTQGCYRISAGKDKQIIIPYEFLLEEEHKESVTGYIQKFFQGIIDEEAKKKTP